MAKFIEKKGFDKFIDSLRKRYEVIAPVEDKILKFKIIEKGDKIIFGLPYYPAKKYFLPHKECLFKFKNSHSVRIVRF